MTDLSHISAMILAGGAGTRLQSKVADRSKVMAEVAGRPFIAYNLDALEIAGVRHVVICTGHHAEHLENTLGSRYGAITLEYSREIDPLGTGGAIRLGLGKAKSDPILVMNGDSYFTGSLTSFYEDYRRHERPGFIQLCRMDNLSDYGSVEVNDTGQITRFVEKLDREVPGWINAGIYLLQRSLIEEIPTEQNVSLETGMFPRWAKGSLGGYKCSGNLLDIGTPERLSLAESFFECQRTSGERSVANDH